MKIYIHIWIEEKYIQEENVNVSIQEKNLLFSSDFIISIGCSHFSDLFYFENFVTGIFSSKEKCELKWNWAMLIDIG